VTASLPAPRYADLLALAVDVAREAAALVRRGRATAGDDVEVKSSPVDVVTAVDTAAERLVVERLLSARPEDGVLGEEGADRDGTSGVRWVIDPIDGTVNFLYGMPWYAVSVAAVRDGASVAGAVIEPASGRLWSAAVGGGATCDGRPLRVSAASDVSLSLLGTGFSYSAERRVRQVRMVSGLLPHVRDVRRMGAAALDLCAVAAGWVDAYLEHGCNWWDWAAGALIAAEAGAVVRTPGPTGSVPPDDGLGADALFAATPGIADEVSALAREHGAASV
jgi:myo-inositol-1(or 4)-monophosphatase